MGILDHLTCLLKNLYAGQEATELDMEQWTGSKLGKEYDKAIYCHPACCIYMQSESESCSVMSNSLQPHGLHRSWNSPGQNTGVGSLSFLQWIFPTQGLNPGLLHYRQILYQLSYQGIPIYRVHHVKC